MRKIYIFLFIIFSLTAYSQSFNSLLNKNTEAIIVFSLSTNDNKITVKANIPEGYYAYLESKIANKILFFADNKEINTTYPKGEKYHEDIIIKGEQEFILNDIDINKIDFELYIKLVNLL